MSQINKIPTPWPLKWRRFRYNVLPLIFFIFSVGAMLWLWQGVAGRPNAVGAVEAVSVDVCAGADGLLFNSPKGTLTLFDHVDSGQLLARLDDRPLKAQLETLLLELKQLQAEIDAAELRAQVENADRMSNHQQEAVRLTWQVERARLEVLDRKILVETGQLELDRLNAELEFLDRANAIIDMSELDLNQKRLRRDEVAKSLELNQEALTESSQQLVTATKALADYPPFDLADTERLLSPLRASLAVCESRIAQAELQIQSLDIRAPISGTICSINYWQGQHIQGGTPIASIAADEGRYIVSYIRQEQHFKPKPGMPVVLRLRQIGAKPVETIVEGVGPQFEPMPPQHLRDPNTPEWGQPVRIAPPEGMALRPGEMVDLTFSTESQL